MPRCSRTMCSKAGWLLSKRDEWSHVWQQSEETLDGRPLPFPSMFAWKFFLTSNARVGSLRACLRERSSDATLRQFVSRQADAEKALGDELRALATDGEHAAAKTLESEAPSFSLSPYLQRSGVQTSLGTASLEGLAGFHHAVGRGESLGPWLSSSEWPPQRVTRR